MTPTISPLDPVDTPELLSIFNHYVETSMAAYPETPLTLDVFAQVLRAATGFPSFVAHSGGRCAGFAFLRPYHPLPVFSSTAELSIFLHPEFTHQGIGTRLLQHLIAGARKKGLVSILASISSLNPESIAFHQHHGFTECGRFSRVGCKKGIEFDVRYFQLMC